MHSLRSWLYAFVPGPVGVNGIERLRACCGALLGIMLTGLVTRFALGPATHLPLLIAPMGASAVLLFAVPSSPLAQPWSIVGGNLVSALIGVACAHWIADPVFAAALAIAGAIGAMFALRCLHPPSGAVALTAVLGGPAVTAMGYHFVAYPVAVNSLLLLGVALAFNNATRRRYPHAAHIVHPPHANTHGTADAPTIERIGFKAEDLDAVLKQYNQVLDVSRDDLENLFLQTEMHAYRRRFGEITCGDIMSRDVLAVEFGTSLEEAWTLLREHRIKALPVVDTAHRVIGIVTLRDFMQHADLDLYQGFEDKLRRFLKRSFTTHSEKPEVVGQIMTKRVRVASIGVHIVELVPLLADTSHHHIPILNEERRLVGIVTQSDLVAALYRGRLADTELTA